MPAQEREVKGKTPGSLNKPVSNAYQWTSPSGRGNESRSRLKKQKPNGWRERNRESLLLYSSLDFVFFSTLSYYVSCRLQKISRIKPLYVTSARRFLSMRRRLCKFLLQDSFALSSSGHFCPSDHANQRRACRSCKSLLARFSLHVSSLD